MAKFCHRAKPPVAGDSRDPVGLDPKFVERYPALFEYMTLGSHEDGTPRVGASVILFFEQGRWKACVSDRDNDRSGFVSETTWEGLWKAVEKALAADSMDWRVKRDAPRRK